MIITVPFGNTEATITGTYYPGTPARMYLANGDPGYEEEYPDFDIDTFEVGGEDILEILMCFDVHKPLGQNIPYLDSILDMILEKAYDQYLRDNEPDMGADEFDSLWDMATLDWVKSSFN